MSHGGRARTNDPGHRSAQRPSERRRQADPARVVAYRTLRAVTEGAYANLELPGRIREARLGARDAAFATELVYGVTRMRGFYDAVLARGAGREVEAIDAPVLDALRLGAHQLLGMRVPAHAAVDATVGLVRSEIGAGPASFTNAVLRRVSEKSAQEWRAIVAPHSGLRPEEDPVAGATDAADDAAAGATDQAVEPGAGATPPTGADLDLDDVAVATSHPVWIVRALRTALLAHGASDRAHVDADLLTLLTADNTPAEVTLVARPGLADVEELLDAGARPGAYSPTAAVLDRGGDPGRLPAVRGGRAAVQDEGSQLLVHALLAAYDARVAPHRDASAPARWLDLCAGPGGKAALLAALAIPRGAQLFCNEVSEHRADLVESTLGAAMDAGAEVFVGVGDGRSVGREEPASFDLVLLDAPCTGLGALRRRPDARWRRTPSDVPDLTALQEELLDSGLDALAPGGVLAYATCSPHDAETLQVVRRVLARREDVRLLDAPAFLDAAALRPVSDAGSAPESSDARPDGRETPGVEVPAALDGAPSPADLVARTVQLWPHRHGTDAMFLALLTRVED